LERAEQQLVEEPATRVELHRLARIVLLLAVLVAVLVLLERVHRTSVELGRPAILTVLAAPDL
jgi:hypothetical protein